jgi:hypothetical protein
MRIRNWQQFIKEDLQEIEEDGRLQAIKYCFVDITDEGEWSDININHEYFPYGNGEDEQDPYEMIEITTNKRLSVSHDFSERNLTMDEKIQQISFIGNIENGDQKPTKVFYITNFSHRREANVNEQEIFDNEREIIEKIEDACGKVCSELDMDCTYFLTLSRSMYSIMAHFIKYED